MSSQVLATLIQQKLRPSLWVHLYPVFLLVMGGLFYRVSQQVGFPLHLLLLGFALVALGTGVFLGIWIWRMHGWSRDIALLMQQEAHDTVVQKYARYAFSARERQHHGV